jgi:phenylacetate-CoA ligase
MSVGALVQRLSPAQRRRLKTFLGFVPPRLRQGRVYWRWRHFLEEAQHWNAERIATWQVAQLREVVHWAVSRTEGYRELYQKAGIKPGDIQSLADLRHLPFTSKELFRDNLEAFTVPTPGARYATTGGSTGIPFGFYEAPETTQMENAFMHTGWTWTGWKLGDPSAVLRGGFVGSESHFSEYDPFHRELFLSSYYLTLQTVGAYVEAIRSRGIRVLQAYPSSLNLLCDLLKEKKLEGQLPLDVVFLGSENVYSWQLEKAEQVLPGTRFFAWYGHCEKAVLAPWCEKTRLFHAWPFYGATELLGTEGAACAEGEEGELVGTSFHQRVTPFIRYRTMDRAVAGPPVCDACRRPFPTMSKIVGRAHEVIVTRSGRFISMTAINMHDDIFDALRQFQFRQERAGEVTFQYVPKESALTAAQAARIRSGLEAKLGGDVTLALQGVSEIPRTKSGKYRFLDQHLPIQYGDRA